ncbi:MAG: TolC family protein [Bacteroidales bacterium]
MHSIKNIILLIVFFLLALVTGSAQTAYTLQECMIYAREHAPANHREGAQVRIYKQDQTEALGAFLPSANVSIGGEYDFGRSLDPETNTYKDSKYFSNAYSGNLQLPLFQGLVRINNYKMTRAMNRMGLHRKQLIEDQVSLRVLNAFYNVVYYKQLVMQLAGQLAESEQNLYQSQRMEELGMKAGADIAQMEANVASDQFALIRQENLLRVSLLELKGAMNYPMEDTLAVEETLEPILPQKSKADPDSLFKAARHYLPGALAAGYQLKGMESSYKSSLASFFPSFSLFAGYNTRYFEVLDGESKKVAFKDQWKNNAGQFVGMQVSIPIFNRLTALSNRRRAKFRLQMQQADYEETMLKLNQDIAQSISDLNGAAQEYIQAMRKMNAADIAHTVNRRKFEEGMISALELQNSANQLAQAKAEQVGMHVQFLIRKKQVEYYQGTPFITENN